MEISTSQRLSFGRRDSSQVAGEQSRPALQQAVQGEPRASLRPRVSDFLVRAACKSKFKVVTGPAGPVSCSSLPKGGQLYRFESSGRVSPPVLCRAGASLWVRSVGGGRSCPGASMSELAVAWHFHRRAASPHRRPNLSVKGTSRKRAAPYVER
jgi:hypothetical protein